MAIKGRPIVWQIAPLPTVVGDASLLKQVLTNLIDNAVKYSRMRDPATIQIGCAGEEAGRAILFVRDNGVGFDMQYAHSCSGCSSGCIGPRSLKAPASDWPRSAGS